MMKKKILKKSKMPKKKMKMRKICLINKKKNKKKIHVMIYLPDVIYKS